MTDNISLENITFDDLYENIKVLSNYTPDYYRFTYPAKMRKACRIHKVLVRTVASRIIDAINKLDSRPVVFVYPAERFPNLCEKISGDFNILTFSNIFLKTDTVKKYGIKVLSNSNLQNEIFKSFNTGDMRFARHAQKNLIKVFENNNVGLIIIGDDWTFFERMCAIAGRLLNVPVVSLQHGIYHKDAMIVQQSGKVSTYFWCWSNYVKDSYEALFNPVEGFVQVVGYPHKLLSDYKFVNKDRVLFMSTPYYEDDRSKYDGFMDLIREVISICDELHLEFVIRLHPRDKAEMFEREFGNLHNFNISKEKNLYKDIKDSGIIIGDLSSTLLEANLLHRRSVQIKWNEIVENFSKNELYDSLIKVGNQKVEIKHAIASNIGQYYDDEKLFYHTGDPKLFEMCIVEKIKKTMNL